MSISLRDDNILVLKSNEGVQSLSVPEAEECAAKIKAIIKLNEKPKVILFSTSGIYAPKSVIRCYTDTEFGEVGIALLCPTYAAWLVGNIGATIRKRFMSLNPTIGTPVKVFKEEKKALEWSLNLIKKASMT